MYHLGTESLWFDEAFSILEAREIQQHGTFYKLAIEDSQPPLFVMLLSWWMHLGSTEALFRVLPALFGIGSIIMWYLLIQLFSHGNDDKTRTITTTPVIATFIMALSPIQILYAQDLRVYALFVFVSLLSLYCFFKWLQTNKTRGLIAYTLSVILGLYAFYFFLFVLLFQGVYLLIQRQRFKKNIKQWYLGMGIGFVAYLPWLITYFFLQVVEAQKRISSSMIARAGVPSWLAQLGPLLFFVPVLFVPFMVVFYLKYEEKIKTCFQRCSERIMKEAKDGYLLLLLVFIFAAEVLLFYKKDLATPLYLTRFTVFALPLWYFIEARCIMHITSRMYQIIAVVLLIISLVVPLTTYYTPLHKEDWRGVAAYLKETAHHDDLILTTGIDVMLPLNYYFNNTIEQWDVYSLVNSSATLADFKRYPKDTIQREQTKQLIANKKDVFLIVSHERDIDDLLSMMTNLSTKSEAKNFKGITVYDYILKP